MVDRKSSTRVTTTPAMKARAKAQEDYILLARGLSARLTGSNTPLAPLTHDEMERDLRHIEAFANACTSYAQQYYRYTNQNNKNAKENSSNNGSNNNKNGGGDGTPGSTRNNNNTASHETGGQGGSRGRSMPIIAMPVRIDPEEEKRLQTLRQKIQLCEARREIYEGQYLSLRAHYISLSKKLKGKREDVDSRIGFLQEQVVKRGHLLALQRVRIQVVRETLSALKHRMANPSAKASSKSKEDLADLHAVWTSIDQKWKEAEEAVSKSTKSFSSSSSSSVPVTKATEQKENESVTNPNVLDWPASTIPKIPPGVPLLLSQLGLQPGNAVAWGTCGAFGAKPDSLVWIKNQVPTEKPDRSDSLPGLREDVAQLKQEIQREQSLNREFQSEAIKMRKENDELVSMMTLLRSETEGVVARHNILLESDDAKTASQQLYEEEAVVSSVADAAENYNNNTSAASGSSVGSSSHKKAFSPSDGASDGHGGNENHGKGERYQESDGGDDKTNSNKSVTGTTATTTAKPSGLKEDDENDGDDEGSAEELDEGEIIEGSEGGEVDVPPGKRSLVQEEENDSSRSKRRKL